MSFIVHGAILSRVLPIEASLTIWSRLEPVPSNADLRPGLQARTADPLWLIGRQWQFRELQGEDAGSPIHARVNGVATPLAQFSPGPVDAEAPNRTRNYADSPLPLEVLVEREPVRATHPRLAAEAGNQFLRYLADEGAGSQRTRYQAVPAFRLDPITVADPAASPDGLAWATLLAGRALDGRKLAAAFRPLADDNYVLSSLPAEPAIPTSFAARVRRAAGRWLRWYDDSIQEPAGPPEAWNPSRQEYAFAVGAEVEEGPVVLVADEYRDGRLDWYSFRATGQQALGAPARAVPPADVNIPPMLPVPVRYPGMPADRFWEFEDARVNFAELKAGRTDLVQILLTEFALAYGNDWFVIPVPVDVGSLFRIRNFTVRDTFGVESAIGRSRDNTGVPWSMFELSTTSGEPDYLRDLFFLAPTLPTPLAGDPIEQVALFRDEMANLCWAVERRVQGNAGETVDRYLEANRTPLHQQLVQPPPDVRLIYHLATPVPEHWIPFVPVPANLNGDPAGIQLERRVLLRFDANGASHAAHPHGTLLRRDTTMPADQEAPLRLFEEEVPREGALVERAFQYARGPGGESYLWIGRDKRVGAGEGASLLRFDSTVRTAGR
jgi:hypothetical protein